MGGQWIGFAKEFENGQEGTLSTNPDLVQDLFEAFPAFFLGEYKLILSKAFFAIHAIPVVDEIEGIEKRFIGNNGFAAFGELLMVVEEIEGFYAKGIQNKAWQLHGHIQLQLFRLCQGLLFPFCG